jgi:hypothetical protein
MDTVMTGFVHEIIILIEKKGDNNFFQNMFLQNRYNPYSNKKSPQPSITISEKGLRESGY